MASSIESVSNGIEAEEFVVEYEINAESTQDCHQEEVLSSLQTQTTNGLQRLVEEEVHYCATMPHLQHIKNVQAALKLCKQFEALIECEADDYRASNLFAFLSQKIAPYDPRKALELLEKCPVNIAKTQLYIEISKHQNIIDADTTLKKAREELTLLLVRECSYVGDWYFQHMENLALALYNEEKKRGFLNLNDTFADFLKSFEKSSLHLKDMEYPKSINETLRVLLLMHQPSSSIKDFLVQEHDSFMNDFSKYPPLYTRYLPTLAAVEGRAKLPHALESLETFWNNVPDTYVCLQMLRVQVAEPYFSNTIEKSVSKILDLIENGDEWDSDIYYSMMFDALLENNYLELAQSVLSSMTDEYDVFERMIALYESQVSQDGFDIERALTTVIAQQEKVPTKYYFDSCILVFEFAAKYLGFPAAMKYSKYLEAAKESYMETPWHFFQIRTILDIERKYNLPESIETLAFINFLQKYGGSLNFVSLEFIISEKFSQFSCGSNCDS